MALFPDRLEVTVGDRKKKEERKRKKKKKNGKCFEKTFINSKKK